MLGLILGVLKVFGLRAASGAVAVGGGVLQYLTPILIVIGLLWGVSEYGRYLERLEAAQRSADYERRLLRISRETSEEIERRAEADDAELAAEREQAERIRDANSDDSRVLFSADDEWLRQKRAAGSGRSGG